MGSTRKNVATLAWTNTGLTLWMILLVVLRTRRDVPAPSARTMAGINGGRKRADKPPWRSMACLPSAEIGRLLRYPTIAIRPVADQTASQHHPASHPPVSGAARVGATSGKALSMEPRTWIPCQGSYWTGKGC
ncbi:hypothetical protein EDB80DRAFT_386696 [Ilyonectria destructans]|nr:hypothetical protein EDB80DRAFT_386696 [Ilyonectria destructans]